MQCPNCGQYDPHNNQICPNCQHPITSHSNPYYTFLRNNFPFFAIVGFFGTMLALLPNLLDKLKDGVWIGSLGASGLILFISLILIIVFLIILTIFFIYEVTLQTFNLPIIVFSFIFLLFLFGFIAILNNLMSNFLWYQLFLNVVLWYWIAAFLFACSAFLFQRTIQAPNNIVRGTTVVMVLIGCFLFWVLFLQVYDASIIAQRNQTMKDFPQNIKIYTDSNYFNPNIHSSVGLGIFLSNVSDKTSEDLKPYFFEWNADYGYFVKWLPQEQRIVYLSNTTIQIGDGVHEKILWTYNKDDIGKLKRNVTVDLIMKNSTSGSTIKRTLQMTWIDGDIAHVEDNPVDTLNQTILISAEPIFKNQQINNENKTKLFKSQYLPSIR